jgi:hypothetical protein
MAKKRPATQEPLLNAVARKLGHAAGTLTKATHEFTETFSALPENLTTKVRNATTIGEARSRPPRLKKTIRRAASKVRAKNVAKVSKRKPGSTQSPRSAPKRAQSGK